MKSVANMTQKVFWRFLLLSSTIISVVEGLSRIRPKSQGDKGGSLHGRIECPKKNIFNGKCFMYNDAMVLGLAMMHCINHEEYLATPTSLDEQNFMKGLLKDADSGFLTDIVWSDTINEYLSKYQDQTTHVFSWTSWDSAEPTAEPATGKLSIFVDTTTGKWNLADTYKDKKPYFCTYDITEKTDESESLLECRAVEHPVKGVAATDRWCDVNCRAHPPFCPASHCTCIDGQVEFGAAVCPSGSFPCPGGLNEQQCIHGAQICDGVSDCADGNDEAICKRTVCEVIKLGGNATKPNMLSDKASCIRAMDLVKQDKNKNSKCIYGKSYYWVDTELITNDGCGGDFKVCYTPRECKKGWTLFMGRCYKVLDKKTDQFHAARLCKTYDASGDQIPHLKEREEALTGYRDYNDYGGYGVHGGPGDYADPGDYGASRGYGTTSGYAYDEYNYGDYGDYYYGGSGSGYNGGSGSGYNGGSGSGYYGGMGSGDIYSGYGSATGSGSFEYYYGGYFHSRGIDNLTASGDDIYGEEYFDLMADYWGAPVYKQFNNDSYDYGHLYSGYGSGSSSGDFGSEFDFGPDGHYSDKSPLNLRPGYGYNGHSQLVSPDSDEEYQFLISLTKRSAGSGCASEELLKDMGFWTNEQYFGQAPNKLKMAKYIHPKTLPKCDEDCKRTNPFCIYVDIDTGFMNTTRCDMPAHVPICVNNNKRKFSGPYPAQKFRTPSYASHGEKVHGQPMVTSCIFIMALLAWMQMW